MVVLFLDARVRVVNRVVVTHFSFHIFIVMVGYASPYRSAGE